MATHVMINKRRLRPACRPAAPGPTAGCARPSDRLRQSSTGYARPSVLNERRAVRLLLKKAKKDEGGGCDNAPSSTGQENPPLT